MQIGLLGWMHKSLVRWLQPFSATISWVIPTEALIVVATALTACHWSLKALITEHIDHKCAVKLIDCKHKLCVVQVTCDGSIDQVICLMNSRECWWTSLHCLDTCRFKCSCLEKCVTCTSLVRARVM